MPRTVAGALFENQILVDVIKNLSENNQVKILNKECYDSRYSENIIITTHYNYYPAYGGVYIFHPRKFKKIPDMTIFIPKNKMLYLVEIKYQKVEGSVIEKFGISNDLLQWHKNNRINANNIDIKLLYVLCDFFRDEKHTFYLNVLNNKRIPYFFNAVDLVNYIFQKHKNE
jgi:hypothetical protein